MREIRLSGLEGGVALTRHPYPYNPGIPLPFEAFPLDFLSVRVDNNCVSAASYNPDYGKNG